MTPSKHDPMPEDLFNKIMDCVLDYGDRSNNPCPYAVIGVLERAKSSWINAMHEAASEKP